MKKFKSYIFRILAVVILILLSGPVNIHALEASHYASSSRLSSGKWVKISTSSSGMQFVSNTQLKSMGFNDPSKVNVFGYGGRMIKEILDENEPDDLPLLPCVRTGAGIIFFGTDHILWEAGNGTTNYSHTMQPYSETSYYFLSDADVPAEEMASVDLRTVEGLENADSFIERIVHEQDLYAPGVSGRTLLGEDLRSAVQLQFPLPDNVGGDATASVVVGSKITGSNGTLKLSSQNAKLSQNSATIEVIKSSEQFMRSNTLRVNASGCGNSLQLGMSVTTGGAVNFARLDYVEVEYERSLTLPSDQLYFYFNEDTDIAAVMKGITEETEIWEVTRGHQPLKVMFNRSGGSASFRVESGYHEFVAFNPSKVSKQVTPAGNVANQDIHAMESPDLLIITPAEYMEAARKVADLHRQQDSMTVHLLTPEEIYNEFSSGTPDVSAFRKAMKMWFDRDTEAGVTKLKYCLIFSRPTYDNKMVTAAVKGAGYPRVPIWQSPTGFTDNNSYSTDDFIGMLEDNPRGLNMGTQKINVAVGRFPVRSAEEALAAAEKLISYSTDPERDSWRNNVMIIADDQDSGQHLSQSEKMYENMVATPKGSAYQYERLYLDTYEQRLTSVGLEYPEAKKRLLSKFEEGQALVTYIGHANTVSWTHEHLLLWNDITSFSNTRLPVLYAATCEFARWDADDYSGGEVMWAFPKTGVIAMICPSRAVYISMNGPVSAQFGLNALTRNPDGSPARLGDAFVNSKNGISGNDDNKLRYALLGDPAMRMPVYSYDVATTSIQNVDVTSADNDLPVIEARSNPVVKGVITDHEGNLASDFNGYLYLKLYDAEKVIETNGNGDAGKVMLYNDRTTKLYDGATKVTAGQWETTVYMPSEIENNFTTGRITYYALSDDGREANGSTEKFHVFGYNNDAPYDDEGPEILSFYLNHEDFKDGGLTYKTPLVKASFRDDSGINLSDAGIGHALSLDIDGKTYFNDIINFYTPDVEDSRKGSISYQLPEIEAGKHTLTLTVWDCANNSSSATLNFNVAAAKVPDIYEIGTNINADSSGVEFIINSDRPLASLACSLEVFDINGIRVWHSETNERTGADSTLRVKWDYTSAAGNRVAKGIYICRATVTSPEGKSARKSRKIVISK